MTVPRTGDALRAVQAEQDSEYSSDEDECTSDQDDRGPAYESDDDDGYDRIANDDLDALMRCFDDEDAALSRSRVTSSPFPLLDPTFGPLMSNAAHALLVCVLWALLVFAVDRVR